MLDETEKKVTQLVGETMESTIESPFEIDPNHES
jgi:hypothetical protein